ncbi:dihydroxyacetone kinase subunit L [Arthrobacter agilis]|uniref:dihydroxyacetone kinase subunit DhaL n=1 Tax=Arthrobacter agilis TaxID=37921 RepID=UPI000B34E07F|nr:dihydroxyacetone kinase subunit DhaL [Arthrobacter agilis]OUM42395.1 dihydroxyacetone kinase subunit L [Arthrobacter agilis]PPB45736.1 dihydroxyacetone kinase subunit L [Arthrobacter agilis]TPV26282.1 dihydroxyacetone kinase subunit L [Arthrobacter agilis]VDR30867.1 PTS-dependent dihydroxyacetone kinase, ADP-binding subunit dhaL [Arthrobacter agilis]
MSVEGTAGDAGAATTLDTAWAVRWMRDTAQVVSENRALLIDLDRAIGDADHGENLDRGFGAVLSKLDDGTPETPAAVLKLVAMTLMSTVGGAAGPLYGTAFLRAATSLGDATAVEPSGVAGMIAAARDGIVARGKAEVGDKTMVDAWTPAAEAAQTAALAGATAPEVLAAAANAAHAGAVATEPLIARKGRASYLGERSAGHQDPGAVSTALILQAAAEAAGGEVA